MIVDGENNMMELVERGRWEWRNWYFGICDVVGQGTWVLKMVQDWG